MVNNNNLREWLARSSRLPEHVRNHFFANLTVIEKESAAQVVSFKRSQRPKRVTNQLKNQQSLVSTASHNSRG